MKRIILTVITAFGLAGTATADPWKDESGHGRRSRYEYKWDRKGDKDELKFEHRGETPWFERGSGYRDGHFKHGKGWHSGYGNYHYLAPPVYYPPPPAYYPPPPPVYYWGW